MFDKMIYMPIEKVTFNNSGNIISIVDVKTITIALKEDVVGRQFVFMKKDDGKDLIIYSGGHMDEKKSDQGNNNKKSDQIFREVTERLLLWKFQKNSFYN